MSTSRGVDGCNMRRSAILSGLICTALIAPAVAQEQDFSHITIEQIVAAWQARHAAVQSFECTIEETTVHLPGTLFGRDMRPFDDEGQPFPRDALTLRLHRRIAIDGSNVHADRTGDNWVHRAEEVQSDRLLWIINGDRCITFFGTEDRTDHVHPLAFISPARGDASRGNYPGASHAVWPVFHAFRNGETHDSFGPFDAVHWRVTDRTGSVHGQQCAVLEDVELTAKGVRHELWVLPQQDFCVARKLLGLNQLDMRHSRDSSGLWVPVEWTHLESAEDLQGNPVLVSTQEFKVVQFAVNEPVDPKLFDFEFPPGTKVKDYTAGVEPTGYVVLDGSERNITDEEVLRGARYTDLVSTDSGTALSPPRQFSIEWLALLVVAVCAAAAWCIYQRRG